MPKRAQPKVVKPAKPAVKRGQVAHKPTDKQREYAKMSAIQGVTHDKIAAGMGISKPTLLKYYRDELDHGLDHTNNAVAGALFNMAMTGNVAAAIFWLKIRAGWREQPTQMELTGKDGKPLEGDAKTLLIDKVMGLIEQAKIKDVAALPAPTPPIDKTKH